MIQAAVGASENFKGSTKFTKIELLYNYIPQKFLTI